MSKYDKNFSMQNNAYQYDGSHPLVSMHLASNRPDQLAEFVKNVDETVSHKNAYEIIVKIDDNDTAMIERTTELVKQFGAQRLKVLVAPKKAGPWSLWEAYNALFHMADKNVYFVWNPSDEVRFVTPHWDKILLNYVGFFKDHLFRLKLSDNRLRNFYQLYEVLGTPDNFPFVTKRWVDLCGQWCDCHSSDLFQQAVSYYLGKKNIFRDVPIFDIELSGIEAGLLIPQKEMPSRLDNIRRLWLIALSKKMRSRYLAHAEKIHFFIESCAKGAKSLSYQEKTAYPSELICQNDLGESRTIKCLDRRTPLYFFRLGLRYHLTRLLRPMLDLDEVMARLRRSLGKP